MRQLAPLAVLYLLVTALVLPASPFAADDVTTAPAVAAPADATTSPSAPGAEAAPTPQQPPPAAPAEAQPQPADAGQAAETAPPKQKPVARAATPGSVTIKDFSFGPGAITVNAGDTVTWTNHGPSGHTATAGDGSFDTGVLSKGKSGSHTFTKAGSFSYVCTLHSFMKGTVRVVAASSGGGGSSNGSGSSGSSASGSASGSAAAPGSSAAAGSSGSAASASGARSGPSLPRTGAAAGALALLGALLLGLGAAARRRSPAA